MPPATPLEQITICTNQFFTVHRSLQVWSPGGPPSTPRFQGTYDRLGRGLDMTFNASDLARAGAFTAYVDQYVTGNAGVGVRLNGPLTIPGEVAGDRIGSIIPGPWSEAVFADPDYNIVNNNCISLVAEILNKARLRFIREGIPRAAVRIFRPIVIMRKEWLFPPADGIKNPIPANTAKDVQVLRDVLADPNLPPDIRKQRRDEILEAFGPDEFTVFYSPYQLDSALAKALPIWQKWKVFPPVA